MPKDFSACSASSAFNVAFFHRLSEHVPDAQLSLTRESAAAIQIRLHEEGRRDPGVSVRSAARCREIHGIKEFRSIGDVVDVQEDLQRIPPCELAAPACPNIGLEVIGPSRTV